MRTLVSLDIETTGLDGERDAILEVGIVKFKGEDILEEWSSLINPRRPIPPKIVELTGITDEMAQTGADLWPVMHETSQIVGNCTVIGHNIGFDLGFLRKQKQLERNASIDTFELASILVPHAGRYSLGALAAELGITLPATHRALDDARVTHQLYLKVFERAVELPQETADEIAHMAERSGWLLADFWRDVQEARNQGAFNTSIGAALKKKGIGKTTDGGRQTTIKANRLAASMRRQEQLDAKPLKPRETPEKLNVDAVLSKLAPDSPFAKRFENYEARPQQMDMMREVVKAFNEDGVAFVEAGTGTGKCLTSDTLIMFESGRRASIAELLELPELPAEPILSVDAAGKQIYQKIHSIHRNGERAVFHLRTALGRTITATGNHPLLTLGGWQNLEDLNVGDRIATVRRLAPGQTHIAAHEAFVVGAMLGDGGCIRPDALDFTNFDPDVIAQVAQCIEKLGNVRISPKKAHGHFGFKRLSIMGHQRSGLNLLLEKHGMLGHGARTKRIPRAFFEADAESLSHLLAGLWVTDGSIEKRDGNLTYSSASRGLAMDLQHLLLRLNIVSRVRYKHALLKDQRFDSWHLTISEGCSKQAFITTVGCYMVGRRKQRLDIWANAHSAVANNPNDDLIPAEAWGLIDQERQTAHQSWYALREQCIVASDRTREISRSKMTQMAGFLQSPALLELAENDLYWDRIVSIEPAGQAQTYDLSMDGEPNFVANDIVVHNSLAYLIPSMMWAIQNGERVVISTNTINLQEQLAEKDVPAVIEMLGGAGRAAVMKGKGRYLCQLRLKDLRTAGPKTLDEVRVLTKILIWLPNTLTGDADELFMPAPGERVVFQHLSAQNPACNMNTCSATDCYFYQARRLAESAHVIIVNHALLLADIAVENKALPEYQRLVIDEGHHLETAATDSLTYRIDRDEIGRVLGELGRTSGTERNRRASGLLPEIASKARQSLPVDKSGGVEMLIDQAQLQVTAVFSQTTTFFDLLLDFFADEASDAGDYSQRIRITKPLRNRSGWGQVVTAGDNFIKTLNGLAKSLDTIYRALNELAEMVADFDMLIGRLNGTLRFVTEASEQLNRMIMKAHEESIYWVELENRRFGGRGGTVRLSLNVAPLRVGPLMQRFIWDAKESVVITSATMRTAGGNGVVPAGTIAGTSKPGPTFNYILDRLSATDAETLAVGSPFNYKESTLVYLVNDIPEPNQQGYQQWVERGLIELFRASGGRGLALFTSNAQLRATAKVIAPELIKDDIMVYEQGDGTSRRVMLEQFKAADRAVLLGTRSFWEGVDIQGDKLSALAIVKLPFDVPTDPIFSARSETFTNSFNEYSVPETVLRFRQGFGRLIRSKTDRGVVAIFDKRLISKGYGPAFLNALPEPTITRGPMAGLRKAVEDWLKKRP